MHIGHLRMTVQLQVSFLASLYVYIYTHYAVAQMCIYIYIIYTYTYLHICSIQFQQPAKKMEEYNPTNIVTNLITIPCLFGVQYLHSITLRYSWQWKIHRLQQQIIFPLKKKRVPTSSIFDSPQKGNIFAGDGYFPLGRKENYPLVRLCQTRAGRLLVGGLNHLETYESQWEGLSHILWNIKHV